VFAHVRAAACAPCPPDLTIPAPSLATSVATSQKVSTALFFKWNSQLGPPYQVLVDTNFINFSIKNKVRRGGAELHF
jgi:U3 small nucleolar RNA-associated protein 24